MGLSKADLDQFIAAEREALRAGLPEKLAAMEALRRDGRPASLATLERMAHSLYGSTGTFGFKELSATCKALELAARAAGEAGGSASGVEAALREVRESCARLALPGQDS